MTTLASNLGPTTTEFGVSAAIGTAGEVGTIVTIDTEDMAVIAGQGTCNLTVDRGANGTQKATHQAGATVTVGTNSTASGITLADLGVTATKAEVNVLAGDVAGTMTAGKPLIPTTGGVVSALDVTSLKVGGVATTPGNATAGGIQTKELTFTETVGAGTYTGTVVVPAGATVQDVQVRNTALWTASVSASLVIGDGDDANGYVEATNVKTAPIADTNGAGAGFSSRLTLGATIGVYKGGAGKFCAAQKTITATITTVDVATGNTGITRVLVTYAVPAVTAATKA
jgi:hypothetical protein